MILPFHFDEHQAILTYLLGYYGEGNQADPSMFLNYLPDKKLRTIVTEIEMIAMNSEYSERELRDYVNHVLKQPKLLMIKEKQWNRRQRNERMIFQEQWKLQRKY